MHSCLARIWSSKFPEECCVDIVIPFIRENWLIGFTRVWIRVLLWAVSLGKSLPLSAPKFPPWSCQRPLQFGYSSERPDLSIVAQEGKKKKGRACNGAKSNSAELLQHRLWWGRWEAVGEERERFCHLCPQLETPFSFASPVFSGIHESD